LNNEKEYSVFLEIIIRRVVFGEITIRGDNIHEDCI
jgi:hypothetical protein